MRAIARTPSKSCSTLALLLVFVSYSSAALALGSAEQRSACTPDVFRLCSAQIPNVDAIVACLKREKSNLSPDCKAVFDVPERAATSRSLAPGAEDWCAFGANPDAGEQIWRNWCGEAAR